MAIVFKSVNDYGSAGGSGVSILCLCDEVFAGTPIICTDGVTTLTEICPSSSPYEIEFNGIYTGTWIVSGEVDGEKYESKPITVLDFTTSLIATYSIDTTDSSSWSILNDNAGKMSFSLNVIMQIKLHMEPLFLAYDDRDIFLNKIMS
jgi:hypothetical protein